MDETAKPTPPNRAWLPFAWIIAASALAHLWCLGSVFFLDDAPAIRQNPVLLTGRFWEKGMNALTYLGYYIQYRLFGLSAPGFHAVNWLLHTAVACVLFALGRDLLNDRERWRVALFGALLFAVHPLASQVGGMLELDICFACQGLWFDPHENLKLAPAAVAPSRSTSAAELLKAWSSLRLRRWG